MLAHPTKECFRKVGSHTAQWAEMKLGTNGITNVFLWIKVKWLARNSPRNVARGARKEHGNRLMKLTSKHTHATQYTVAVTSTGDKVELAI